jgi:hypothetical protein
MFGMFDPVGLGSVSAAQMNTALGSLGLTANPPIKPDVLFSKDEFKRAMCVSFSMNSVGLSLLVTLSFMLIT